MDKQDTQKLLQQLGKEAKRRQEEAAAQAKRQRRDEPDFAAAVGKVTPLKNSNRVAAPCVGRLDLHGCTREEAQRKLSEFIEEVLRRGVCAEIVHGSGLGSHGFVSVLKSLVRRWLMAHPEVLAYAEPHGANDGAVLILLRKRRTG